MAGVFNILLMILDIVAGVPYNRSYQQQLSSYRKESVMEIKNRVKELRARYNYTQEKLAGMVGVTRQTIAAVEKREYVPSLLLALKICKVFSMPVEKIFWLKGEEHDEKDDY